ncbi:MAG: hypothetical protein H0T74_04770 [Rubrobacteraceae bacterium]|nr:hypothetical protein [Rubrobacteraceae bacterium]
MQTLPVVHQLRLVEFGLRFDEPPLASGERTRYQLDRIYTIDRYLILVVSVK